MDLTDGERVTTMPSQSGEKSESSAVPPADEVVLVQCEKFRCLAFRDRYGKWRSPFSKMELDGVVHVIEDHSD